MGTPRWPLLVFSHADAANSYPAGLNGNAITSAITYQGTSYPAIYKGAVFVSDHTRGWVDAFWLDFDKRVLQGTVRSIMLIRFFVFYILSTVNSLSL